MLIMGSEECIGYYISALSEVILCTRKRKTLRFAYLCPFIKQSLLASLEM